MKGVLVYLFFMLISSTAEPVYENCYRTKLGRGYNGRVNVTASGKTCQEWRSHVPHIHNFTWLWSEENFCRNPDDRASGPWCYTMDPDTLLESCDIPECTLNFEPCMMKPCQNGGKCQGQRIPPYYRCDCDSMWTGTDCEIKVSQCQFHPCQNGATCMDVKEDFMCLCTEDFVGKTCELKIGLCDEENGWKRIGNNCYKSSNGTKLSWSDAITWCGNLDASIPVIDSFEMQTEVNNLALEEKTDLWTGMRNENSMYLTQDFYLPEPIELNLTSFYWHRLYRNSRKDGKCVLLKQPDNRYATARSNWVPVNCSLLNNIVCRKPVGTCPRGWFFHLTRCYKVLDDWQSSWRKSSEHCKMLNSNLLEITSDAEQHFLVKFLQQQRSGIGNDGKFWLNLRRQSDPVKKYWAWESSKQTIASYSKLSANNTEIGECSYMDIDRNGTWHSDDLCSASFGVVCSYEVGSKNWIANKQRDLSSEKNDRQSECGEGWIDNTRSSCYFFIVGLLTWDAAENHCQKLGAHLMSIDDATEHAFIAGLLRFEDVDGSVWIGANCREEEVGYQWADGKPFVYYNWFPGEPDHVTDGDEECVAMFISNAKWTDRSCGQLHPAVCEKPNPSKEILNQASQPDMTKVIDGYCPAGWIPHLNNCFLIQNTTVTWDQASSLCRRQDAHLASISNYLEQYLILSQLPPNFLSTKYGFWIGLRDRKDQTFRWEDRSDVKYIKWQNSEPQGFTPYRQGCTYISFNNGLWADTSCDIYMPGYVCSMPKQANGTVTKSPLSAGCSNDSVGFEGYCYRVFSVPETWKGAEQACQSQHSVLVTISSIRISIFLVSQLMNVQPNILKAWVGYRKTLNESSWSSGNSSVVGQPIVDFAVNSTTKCGFLMTSLLVVLGDCEEKHLFVCEKPREGYIPPTSNITASPTSKQEVICPTNWHEHNGHCYKEFLNKLPWTKARRHCRVLGGRLISVNDRDTSDFLHRTYKDVMGSDWWTGYNKRNPKRVWVWSDDSENLYDPWDFHELSENFGNKHCALMLESDFNLIGAYTEQNCFVPYPFICEVQHGSSVLKHAINNTLEECAKNGYFLYDKYCYSVKTEKKSLYSAQKTCHKEGSELASIHTYEETNFILSLQQDYDVENFFWIGLQKIREHGWERWQWYDNSSIDFAYWSHDREIDVQDKKNCYAISGYQGIWYKKDCLDVNGFICKTRNSTERLANPSTKKTELINGGCPSPFISSPINNKCYMLNDSIVIWELANRSCHLSGGSLLTIQNQLEQDYILSLINSTIDSVWIDLNRFEGETFRHTNKVPVTYTNWDKDQPTATHDLTTGIISAAVSFSYLELQVKCVQLYAENDPSRIGRWNVKSCSTFGAFICEKPKDSSIPNYNTISKCPIGYEEYKKSCYKFGDDSRSFLDAHRKCEQNKGHLVSVTSVYEFGFVQGLSAKTNVKSHWLGLQLSTDDVLYRWTDGIPYLYNHWKESEPSQKPGEECVVSKNGMWMDVSCTEEYPYLCEIDLDRKEDVRPPPTCLPTGIAFDGACYYVERKDKMSWTEARKKCRQYGMELVSVNSATELEVVREIIVRRAQHNVWIGLTNLRKESDMFQNRVYWYWSNGEDVNFTNWGHFEPSKNLLNSDEECVYMDFKSFWYDESCDKEYAFMCKHNGSFSELHNTWAPPGTPLPPKRKSQNTPRIEDNHNRSIKASKQTDDQSSPDVGMTVGVTLGVSIFVLLLIITIIYIMYKKKHFSYPTMSLGFTNAMYQREYNEMY